MDDALGFVMGDDVFNREFEMALKSIKNLMRRCLDNARR